MGVDRGLIVAGVALGFIGLTLLKPWVAAPSRTSAGLAVASPTPTVARPAATDTDFAVAPAPPEAGPPRVEYLMSPITLSWDEVVATLPSAAPASTVVSFLPGAGQPVVQTALRSKLPTTRALGSGCDSAPTVPEGYEDFGFTLPAPDTSVAVVRIFATGGPLPVSTDVATDGGHSLALVSLRWASWPVGHYALVLQAPSGTTRFVPFCVTADVPASADTAQARNELWDEAQP